MADDGSSTTDGLNKFTPQVATLVRTIDAVPVIYADGILNQVRAPGISKFHFFRDDAVVGDSSQYTKVEVLQIIMPVNGFVDMLAFFEHRLKLMIEKGQTTQEFVDSRRNFYSGVKPDPYA
jgi:hypothetical protein